MQTMTFATAALTISMFDYEMTIDGDAMIGTMYCNGNEIYKVQLV